MEIIVKELKIKQEDQKKIMYKNSFIVSANQPVVRVDALISIPHRANFLPYIFIDGDNC